MKHCTIYFLTSSVQYVDVEWVGVVDWIVYLRVRVCVYMFVFSIDAQYVCTDVRMLCIVYVMDEMEKRKCCIPKILVDLEVYLRSITIPVQV